MSGERRAGGSGRVRDGRVATAMGAAGVGEGRRGEKMEVLTVFEGLEGFAGKGGFSGKGALEYGTGLGKDVGTSVMIASMCLGFTARAEGDRGNNRGRAAVLVATGKATSVSGSGEANDAEERFSC